MSKLLRIATLWLWGGFFYYIIEVAWRGYSHPSMFIVGGLCFVLIGGVNNWFPWELGLFQQSFIGVVAVTVTELISGLIINRWLGLNVWDYSDMPFNVWGQICLLYCFAWVFLSAFAIWLDDFFRWKLYGEGKPQYTLI